MVRSGSEKLVVHKDSTKLIQQAEGKEWIAYVKKPFAGPEQVLEYLGRYTHRIALANHRLKSIENGKVVFTYKDRQKENKVKTMELTAMEFIRRFLLHVLPFRFMKIRYYGFLANICKKKSVLLIRRLIGKVLEFRDFRGEETREKLLRLIGVDILLCPQCQKGQMLYQGILPIPNTS